MKKVKIFFSCLLVFASLWLSLVPQNAVAQHFYAELEKTNIELGESFQVTFSFVGDVRNPSPHFAPLTTNFDILSSRTSTSLTVSNGKRMALYQWIIELEPHGQGKLLIPPITVMGQTSEAIPITVKPPSTESQRRVMLETIIDKSSVYVQEQIKITYRIYYSIPIIDLRRETLDIPDARVFYLEEQNYQRKVDGKNYEVAEFVYFVLPQKSGTLDIPQLRWEYLYSRDNSRRNLKRRAKRTQAKILRVKPIPNNYPQDAAWLPARELTLTDNWQSDLDAITIGEPITREIITQASGLEATQLPPIIQDGSHNHYQIYTEKPDFHDAADKLGLLSTRKDSAAIVVSSEPEVTLPKIQVPWWNTETDSLAYATIEAVTLKVLPSSKATNTFNEPQAPRISEAPPISTPLFEPGDELATTNSAGETSPLVYILICTNVLSLMAVFGVYLWRKSNTPSIIEDSDDSDSKRPYWIELLDSAKSGTPNQFYSSLGKWIRGELRLAGVEALAYQLHSEGKTELAGELLSLTNSLYSGDTTLKNTNPERLVNQLKTLRTRNKTQGSTNPNLSSFYPQAG